jgi:hypothetical protein
MKPRPGAWSKFEDRQLRSLYPLTATPKVAEALHRTIKSVTSRAKVLGLRKKLGYGGRKQFTSRQDNYLRSKYADSPTQQLARVMRLPVHTVYQRAKRLGLKKSQAYMDSPAACRLRRGDNVGATHRFLPGHVPANRGLRRPGWAPGRMAETQFKPGTLNGLALQNHMPPWTFRFNADGYLLLKTGDMKQKAPNKGWEYVHKLIWEQAYGPLPDWREARLWWKDGDHANCSLANLELISSAEHMRRTTVHNLPSELVKVIQLSGALKRKIRNRERKQNEKHDGRSAQSSVRSA